MKKLLLGPLVAAVVLFAWGFVYYGLSGVPYGALATAPRDVGPALNEMFPTSGTYIVPDPRGDRAANEKLMQRGPIATVHVHKEGSQPMDPLMLVQGFALDYVCCVLLAVLLNMSNITGFISRVGFALVAGVLITLFSHGGEAIWWQQDWGWHLRTMAHDVVAWLGAGMVLAIFVRPGR